MSVLLGNQRDNRPFPFVHIIFQLKIIYIERYQQIHFVISCIKFKIKEMDYENRNPKPKIVYRWRDERFTALYYISNLGQLIK